uniref:Uncharacterized protein n=1 Tax=Triticum urartu TaxID=4572 RepID=A0A8R7UIA5_TRIUA
MPIFFSSHPPTSCSPSPPNLQPPQYPTSYTRIVLLCFGSSWPDRPHGRCQGRQSIVLLHSCAPSTPTPSDTLCRSRSRRPPSPRSPFEHTGCNLTWRRHPHCLTPPTDTEWRIKVFDEMPNHTNNANLVLHGGINEWRVGSRQGRRHR